MKWTLRFQLCCYSHGGLGPPRRSRNSCDGNITFNSTIFLPTCQVTVVRFYQSALPPPHPPRPPPPPPRLAVLFLLVLLLASSSSSFSSTMSASTSTCTSAFPTLRQALCQVSSPSSLPTPQLSVHR